MYQLESKTYFSHVREDIISMLNMGTSSKVLEVGSGGCYTLVEIKKRGLAKHVTALELFEIKDSLQDSPLIDKLIKIDLNQKLESLNDLEYDVVIAADVLEHLMDPWSKLVELKDKLRNDGELIVSLPNIRNLKTLKKIVLNGYFKYESEGVLDKTHLRFFCLNDMKKMFKEAGLIIVNCSFSIEKRSKVFKFFPECARELFSSQIVFKLRKI